MSECTAQLSKDLSNLAMRVFYQNSFYCKEINYAYTPKPQQAWALAPYFFFLFFRSSFIFMRTFNFFAFSALVSLI